MPADPEAESPSDPWKRLRTSVSGLGISNIPQDSARARSYTIDSFNISSIESYKPSRESYYATESSTAGNWEAATWVFTDVLQSVSAKDKDDVRALITKSNQLVKLLVENPSLKHEVVFENVVAKIQFMLYGPHFQLRSAAYRILRHATGSSEALLHLVRSKILISIIVSLSTPSPQLEREEALKLVREFLNVSDGANYISVGVIKALVALVENELEDSAENDMADADAYSFTRICIETIGEIAVLKPDIVFHGGGLRLLINLTINGATDIATSCVLTLLTLLDMPHARLFMRNGFDLDSLISIFTYFEDDDDGKAPNTKKYHNKALKTSFLLSHFLKTWTGLICFSHNGFQSIKSLLSNLRKRNSRLCAIILDVLLDILRIQSLPWLEDSSIGGMASQIHSFVSQGNEDAQALPFKYPAVDPKSFEFAIISHYQGLLLKILVNCDVVPLLFKVVNENRSEQNTQKATFLLTNIFELCANLLPLEFYDKHILAAYNTDLSLASLAKIEAAARTNQHSQEYRTGEISNKVKEITVHQRIHMDDTAFKSAITSSRVLTVKEFEDWSWGSLSVLFHALRNPQRFNELQEKFPKFLKTFLSFMRPFKYRFSVLPSTFNLKYPKLKKPRTLVVVASQLIESLLTFDQGSEYLCSTKVIAQMAELLEQVDPFSNIAAKEPLLSRKRLQNTLSIGYVKFVGVLSASSRGIKILEKHRILRLILHLVEGTMKNESNNYLVCNLLNVLDYTYSNAIRAILAKAANDSNWKVKMFILENVLPVLLEKNCEQEYVRLLVSLLGDDTEVVVSTAISALFKYFITLNHTDHLNLLIEARPDIETLESSNEGRALLLRFCTIPDGFKYLNEKEFIEKYFAACLRQLRTFEYLDSIETSLRNHFYPYFTNLVPTDERYSEDLHHFFNYLLATEEGFHFFNSKRQFVDKMLSSIKEICSSLDLIESAPGFDEKLERSASTSTHSTGLKHSTSTSWFMSSSPVDSRITASPRFEPTETTERRYGKAAESAGLDMNEYMLKTLKQYLWIVGEIASAKYGMQLLEPVYSFDINADHIAKTLMQLFQSASHWQIRGLAFYQLGKMAETVEGIEILDELDWISLKTIHNPPISLSYPRYMQDEIFTSVEILNPYEDASYHSLFGANEGVQVHELLDLEDEVVIESYEELDEKVLSLINYLSSVLGRIERKAKKELTRIKSENPEVFSNVKLFLKTIRLVDKGKFKYRTRVFIFELFDTTRIMEDLGRKERRSSIKSGQRPPVSRGKFELV